MELGDIRVGGEVFIGDFFFFFRSLEFVTCYLLFLRVVRFLFLVRRFLFRFCLFRGGRVGVV